mgnify:CR=1 FL=1
MVKPNHAGARAGGLGQFGADQIAGLDQLVYRPILHGAVAVTNYPFATRNRALDGRKVCLGICHVSVSSDSRCWSCGVALVEVPDEAAVEWIVERAELVAMSLKLERRRAHRRHRVGAQ